MFSTKMCNDCHKKKKLEYYHKNKNKIKLKINNKKNVLCNYCNKEYNGDEMFSSKKCKYCLYYSRAIYYKKNKHKLLKNDSEVYLCSDCNTNKIGSIMSTKTICKSCAAIRTRIYVKNNKETVAISRDSFKSENNLKCKKCCHVFTGKDMARRHLCKKCLSLKEREFRKSMSDEDKKRYRKYSKKYKEKKRKDAIFNIQNKISCAVRSSLKSRSLDKTIPTFKILNYSPKELKEHLEKQFEPWMNWDNWGTYRVDIWDDNNQSTWTWQIDHIIPISSFKYNSSDDENFQKCWSLGNLRPLSSKENLIKKDRILVEEGDDGARTSLVTSW